MSGTDWKVGDRARVVFLEPNRKINRLTNKWGGCIVELIECDPEHWWLVRDVVSQEKTWMGTIHLQPIESTHSTKENQMGNNDNVVEFERDMFDVEELKKEAAKELRDEFGEKFKNKLKAKLRDLEKAKAAVRLLEKEIEDLQNDIDLEIGR